MLQLYYELGVLTKAVHFKNLSSAALHVGLSQPQLSRIISKIEEEMKVVLLDRSAKRKSGWTAAAFHLSEIFEKSVTRLEAELQALSNNEMIAELHIGTLEGLSNYAIKIAKICFEKVGVKKVVLDVYDLSELEANFLSGNLDLMLSSKTPGRQKFKHVIELGYQQMKKIETGEKYQIYSTFEYGRMNKKDFAAQQCLLVSNSLSVKKDWLETVGGSGYLPTEVRQGKSKDGEAVLVIGAEVLSPLLWEKIEKEISDI